MKCFKNFGIRNPFQNPQLAKNRKVFYENSGVTSLHDLCVKRGTVFHAYDHEEIRIKALETRIANSSLFTSKAEKEFIERLDTLFTDNVHPKRVKMWPIDCYVQSHDVYVQHDGEHWHGLQEKSLKYDKVCEQVKRDRIQDAYFVEMNMKLVRVASLFVKKMSNDELRNLIVNAKVGVTYVYGDVKVPVL